MIYIQALSSLIALIISGFALHIAIKNRRNAIREKLYDRQVNLIIEIKDSFDVLDDLLDDLVWAKYDNDAELLKETKVKLSVAEINTLDLIQKAEIILPDDLLTSLHQFRAFILAEIRKTKTSTYSPNENYVIDRFLDLEEDIRAFIGIEKLSQENKDLIKTKTAKWPKF